MAYKRYVKRGGKVCGPYYYESYRDKSEKVKKRYVVTTAPKLRNKKHVVPTNKKHFTKLTHDTKMLFVSHKTNKTQKEHKVYPNSDISNLSSYKVINLPLKSSGLISLSNLENECFEDSILRCGIFNQINENISSPENSIKSLSLVTNTRFSDFEICASLSSGVLFDTVVMSAPCYLRNFSNLLSTFSSNKNLIFKRDVDCDIFFTSCKLSCILECCFNMLPCQRGESFENFFEWSSILKHFKNLPNHNSSIFKSRFAMTNLTVCNNIIINFNSHCNNYNNKDYLNFSIGNEGRGLVMGKEHEVYSKSTPNDLSSSTSSLVLNTLTNDCFLKCSSLDQIEIDLESANAKYDVSSLSGIDEFACLRKDSNDFSGTNDIFSLINLSNSSISSEDKDLNSRILSLCSFISSSNCLGEYNFKFFKNKIFLVMPTPVNPVNTTPASITSSIYFNEGYSFFNLSCIDLLTFLANSPASFSVNLDLETNSWNLSYPSVSSTLLENASLATSDQLITLNASIFFFNSSGIDIVKCSILNLSCVGKTQKTQQIQVFKDFGLMPVKGVYSDFNSGKEIYFLKNNNLSLNNYTSKNKLIKNLSFIGIVMMAKENENNTLVLLINYEFENQALLNMNSSFTNKVIAKRFVVIRVNKDFVNFTFENLSQDRIFFSGFFNRFFTNGLKFRNVAHFKDSKNSSTELYLIEGSFNAFFNSSTCSGLGGNSSTGCQSICSQNSQSSSVTSPDCLYLSNISLLIKLITALANIPESNPIELPDLINVSTIKISNNKDYLNFSIEDFIKLIYSETSKSRSGARNSIQSTQSSQSTETLQSSIIPTLLDNDSLISSDISCANNINEKTVNSEDIYKIQSINIKEIIYNNGL